MFASKLKSALLAAFLVTSAVSAHADVITFENLVNSYSMAYMPSTFSPMPGYTVTSPSVAAVGSLYASANMATDGTDNLRLLGTMILTSKINPLFTVNSIDLSNYYYYANGSAASTVTLLGTFADGKTILKRFILNNDISLTENDFVTTSLSGFSNIKSFSITGSGMYLGVDNIVINQAVTTDVPEPASLAILGLGLVGIAAARRRKSS